MKRLLNLNIHGKAAILLLVIALAVSFKIMITPGLITHGDITPPLYLERVLNLFYPMWNVHGSASSLQYLNNLMWGSPFMALSALLHLSPAALIEIHLVATLFLAGFCMYYAANKLLRQVRPDTNEGLLFVASIIPALVYMFCPWAIETMSHLAHLWSYALAPLILLAFMKSLQSKKLTYAIGTAFLCALALLGTTWVFFIPILLLSWLVYSLMLSRHDRGEILSHLKVSSLVAVFYVAFSAYWLLPLLLSSFGNALGPTSALSYEALEFVNRNSTPTNVICLRGVWWVGAPGAPGNMPSISWLHGPWIVAGFLIPLSAFAALLLKPRNKYVIYFSAMSVIFLFLGMGTQGPFSVYEWLVFDAPLVSSFGWAIRESYRWVGLVAMTFSFLIAMTILEISCRLPRLMAKTRSRASYIALPLILVFFVSSFALYAAPTTHGWLYDKLVPVKVPQERYQIDEWLSGEGEGFSVMWFPDYSPEGTTWAPDRLVALLDNESSPVPAKGAGEPSLATYRDYIYSQPLLNNETTYFGKFLDILNVRYLIFHDDVLGREEEADTALANLATQNDLELVRQDGFIYVFENEDYAPQVFMPSQNLLVVGGFELLTSLNAADGFNPAQTGLAFSNLSAGIDPDCIRLSNGIILNTNVEDLTLPLENAILIAPFEYTRHTDPSRMWSRTMTREAATWRASLGMRGIENWDFDLGEGLAFTFEALVTEFDFEDEDLTGWGGNVPDIHELLWSDESYQGEHSLKAELYVSADAWGIITSPLIPATYGDWYRFEYYARGQDTHEVHTYIREFDQHRNSLDARFMGVWGNGDFDWKRVSHDFTPLSPETAYVQLQIYHGHETPRPLPNRVWIDGVRVYDMRQYVEPNCLVMPFQVAETGSYELWVRYLQSQVGGEIGVGLDSNPVEVITTRDQITAFVWQEVGTFNLNGGEHAITLENTWGFNAVNLFALIPEGESSEEAIDGLLEDKRVIYILEAESDLYSEGAEISDTYGGEASNGEVVHLGADSRAWQDIEVVKEDNYRMAIRLEGSALVTIDNHSFPIDSHELGFVYLPPIHLEEGEHTIDIQSPSDDGYESSYIDVIWLYSTEAEDETLADLFSATEGTAQVTSYERIDDTKYRVEVIASQPFVLALAEAHDSLWVARVNGKEYESQPLYSVINGFWIDQTGELEIIVEYKPQGWFFYGAGITAVSLPGALGYVIWDWRLRGPKGKRRKGGQ